VALPRAEGKCWLNIVQGLGALADAQSVGDLQKALRDPDREVRLAAGWGLARIGDAGSVDLLLKAADTEGWERIQATKACLMLAEKLLAAGNRGQAQRIYKHLSDTRIDPDEQYVRDAAKNALAAIR